MKLNQSQTAKRPSNSYSEHVLLHVRWKQMKQWKGSISQDTFRCVLYSYNSHVTHKDSWMNEWGCSRNISWSQGQQSDANSQQQTLTAMWSQSYVTLLADINRVSRTESQSCQPALSLPSSQRTSLILCPWRSLTENLRIWALETSWSRFTPFIDR